MRTHLQKARADVEMPVERIAEFGAAGITTTVLIVCLSHSLSLSLS